MGCTLAADLTVFISSPYGVYSIYMATNIRTQDMQLGCALHVGLLIVRL
jgi:hypothetical protein